MHKIIALTDIHLREAGKTIIGLDPVARFEDALSAAISAHPDAKAVILMGDLTHSGRQGEYEMVRDKIANCPIPVTLMLGNHDHRATFLDVFPKVEKTAQGHVQRVIDLPHHRIITLDTYHDAADPHHSGFMCEDRLAWLGAALEGAGGRKPLVFMHHPPHDVGLPGMDGIKLVNGGAVLDMLRGRSAHLFCGHVHRTISGQVAGVPFTMFKSTCHQAPLDLVSEDSSISVDEPGAYGVLLLRENSVVAHSEDVGLERVIITGAEALPEA